MEAYLVGHPLCKSAVNENGKITKSSIEYRLRIIRTEECVPESLQDDVNQLKEALNLCGKRSQKGAEKEPIKGAERKKEILKLIKVNSTITQVEIMKELDLTRKQVQKDMKELQEMHIIAREGTNRRGRWIIVKENK